VCSFFIALFTDSAYALAAGAIAPALRGDSARIGRGFGGVLFIGLGVFTALVGARAAK
jgi:threonine/homoserine/homoserine lactone efflux protein